MLCRHTIHEHVRLRRHDRGIDESQEKESADKGADRCVCRFWVFALRVSFAMISGMQIGGWRW
jgi:hypothetical protein